MKRTALVYGLSGAVGWLSLSQEMLWFRAVGYATGGSPVVFAEVLGAFLVGVAGGALLGDRLSRTSTDVRLPLAGVLAAGGLAYFAGVPLCGWLYTVAPSAALFVMALVIAATACFSGAAFPLLCQAVAPESGDAGEAGAATARIYFANIVGSTLGPLLTGFVLLDHFRLPALVVALAAGTLLLAAAVTATAAESRRRAPALALLAAGMIAAGPLGYAHLLEKLQFKRDFRDEGAYSQVVETRSGIVAVHPSRSRFPGQVTDVVYGGGVFDGTFNVDPVHDSNLIKRMYMAAALHPGPKRTLMIGLSSGSWARVLADYGRVESLHVIEINPGYLKLIADHPEQASLLKDPKVAITIDDARRWLSRHPEPRYDLIVMNTSFHWRDGSTNLLGAEFLELLKRHLEPGGVIYYNSTASWDVKRTAAAVYAHVTEYLNFVAASDAPFDLPEARRRENLRTFVRNGRPVFDRTPLTEAVFETLATTPLPDTAAAARARDDLMVITDDNMATEYKLPQHRHVVADDRSWKRLFERVRW